MVSLYVIALRNKTVAHTFLLSLENAVIAMVTLRHTSPLYTGHEMLSFQIFCHSLAYIICA